MREVDSQKSNSTQQQQQQQQQQSYQESNIYSAETEKLYLKMKEGWLQKPLIFIYSLSNAKKAHDDLENRKILGPAILVPDAK